MWGASSADIFLPQTLAFGILFLVYYEYAAL